MLVLLSGCTLGQAYRPFTWAAAETKTSTGWYKVSTPEFTIFTDLSESQAREAADAAGREMAALRAIMGGTEPAVHRHITGYVVSSDARYAELFEPRVAGLVSWEGDSVSLFLSGRPSRWEHRASMVEAAGSLVTHELAHVVLSEYFRAQPRWFSEGMAEFLESYRWAEDGTTVELGLANVDAYATYRQYRTVGIRDALAWGSAQAGGSEATDRARYGYVWALVHYLINRQPKLFAEVMRQLAQGDEAAANALVTPPDAEAFDQQVHAYIATGQYQTFRVSVPANRLNAVVTEATAQEVAGANARLTAASAGYHGRAAPK